MHNERLINIYEKIQALIISFPLVPPSAYTKLKDTPVPAPATEEFLLWALTFLELEPGERMPFCTSAMAARNEELERFLQSVRILEQDIGRLTGEISLDLPKMKPILSNIAQHCATYATQARLTAEKGEITLADFRRIFRSFLSTGIQSCCGMLFGGECPLAGAALLTPIGTHLKEIGISTPPRSGLEFDYDNYEPYFTSETPVKSLDEHVESILLPAYLLGRSKVAQGLASCYLYKPNEEDRDAVRPVTE